MSKPVNLWLSLRFGQLEVNMSTDELSHYAPDVAADMTVHLIRAFSEGIAELRGHGVIGIPPDDEDDEEPSEDDDEPEDSTD